MLSLQKKNGWLVMRNVVNTSVSFNRAFYAFALFAPVPFRKLNFRQT